MKKSLIALAVLAASGAAMAQSSVTLYGIADIWFGRTSFEETVNGVTTKAPSQTVLQDGGVSNSRWGLKGSEDLGGGLKANFKLEQGFNIDTGAQAAAGKAFSREAWVGVSGGFGEVQLGKANNAFDDVSALAASAFDSDLAAINNVFVSTAFANAYDNTIKYATPSFGGFSGAVSMSLGENKGANYSADSIYSISGKYAAGPLAIGLAYAKEKSEVPGDVYDAKATRLAGSYDLGVAKLLATYGRVKEGNDKVTEYEIGADVPLSPALTLSGGYARSKGKVTGLPDITGKSFGIAVAYSLSKRTTAYAGLNNTKYDTTGYDSKANIYAVGVKHAF
ncbi:porin [Rhodoferax sp. U2-2l]|uniref:porin n=1 Tax=Rhodoferax sp. U2-2l TaxID=2884000 RepID=UPI001D0A61BB|nr:porin [Rhodoferax sp. U2-2l]MCB8745686.1 porin [Rhodoferax sp. U2-2l]